MFKFKAIVKETHIITFHKLYLRNLLKEQKLNASFHKDFHEKLNSYAVWKEDYIYNPFPITFYQENAEDLYIFIKSLQKYGLIIESLYFFNAKDEAIEIITNFQLQQLDAVFKTFLEIEPKFRIYIEKHVEDVYFCYPENTKAIKQMMTIGKTPFEALNSFYQRKKLWIERYQDKHKKLPDWINYPIQIVIKY